MDTFTAFTVTDSLHYATIDFVVVAVIRAWVAYTVVCRRRRRHGLRRHSSRLRNRLHFMIVR